MAADVPGLGGWRPPAFTTGRLAVVVMIGMLGLFAVLLPIHFGVWIVPAWLVLAFVTAAVIRSVPVVPGSWLGRRAVRRLLVGAIAVDCVALSLGTVWPAATQALVLPLVGLVLLDVALGRATERLATALDDDVDERQEAARNRAHRIAYAILALGLGGTLVAATIASPASRLWLAGALGSGGWVVVLQALFVLPAMVLAWTEPDRIAPEADAAPARDVRGPLALALLAVTIVAPFVLSLAPVVLPVRTTSSVSPLPGRCVELKADTAVGVEVEAHLPVHSVACWDGTAAHEVWGLNRSDCGPSLAVLTDATTTTCTRTTGPDGTLRFTYAASVRPVLLPVVHRDVTVRVVLDRDGHLERFP